MKIQSFFYRGFLIKGSNLDEVILFEGKKDA